jgi:hypothetical protein
MQPGTLSVCSRPVRPDTSAQNGPGRPRVGMSGRPIGSAHRGGPAGVLRCRIPLPYGPGVRPIADRPGLRTYLGDANRSYPPPRPPGGAADIPLELVVHEHLDPLAAVCPGCVGLVLPAAPRGRAVRGRRGQRSRQRLGGPDVGTPQPDLDESHTEPARLAGPARHGRVRRRPPGRRRHPVRRDRCLQQLHRLQRHLGVQRHGVVAAPPGHVAPPVVAVRDRVRPRGPGDRPVRGHRLLRPGAPPRHVDVRRRNLDRGDAPLAYDPATKSVLLDGGLVPGSGANNSTWSFHASVWTPLPPSPTPLSASWSCTAEPIPAVSSRTRPGRTRAGVGRTSPQRSRRSQRGRTRSASGCTMGRSGSS